jgi:hypothetical protein
MEKRRKYLLIFALVVVGLSIVCLHKSKNSYCLNSLLPKSKIVHHTSKIKNLNNRSSTQQVINAYSFKRVLWQNIEQILFNKGC